MNNQENKSDIVTIYIILNVNIILLEKIDTYKIFVITELCFVNFIE